MSIHHERLRKKISSSPSYSPSKCLQVRPLYIPIRYYKILSVPTLKLHCLISRPFFPRGQMGQMSKFPSVMTDKMTDLNLTHCTVRPYSVHTHSGPKRFLMRFDDLCRRTDINTEKIFVKWKSFS
jgi:hypothetical protein